MIVEFEVLTAVIMEGTIFVSEEHIAPPSSWSKNKPGKKPQ
jgi:hypothetical protein